jgi:hypothetical protein
MTLNTVKCRGASESNFIRSILLVFFALVHSPVQAVPITGSMGVFGSFTATGGTDLSDATTINLLSVMGTGGTDDIGSTVSFGTGGTVNNGSVTFNPSTAVSNLYTIGGWQLDLDSIWIVDQTVDILTLAGYGTISGNGFDSTETSWTLSANRTGSTYSMTIAEVSLPGIAWIFSTGMVIIGLKQNTRKI